MFAAAPSPAPAGPDLSESLQDLTEALAAASTPAQVFQVVLLGLARALPGGAGTVLLVGESDGRLTVGASDLPGPPDAALPDRLGELAQAALALGAPVYRSADAPQDSAPAEQPGRVLAAALPLRLDGRPLGVLLLAFAHPPELKTTQLRFLRVVAAQTATALGRAQGLEALEARVQARTRELDDQRGALHAFVSFAEAAGTITDELQLGQRALETLAALFSGGVGGYYTLAGGRWQARLSGRGLTPALEQVVPAGLPLDAPLFAEARSSRDAVFMEGWSAQRGGVAASEDFHTAAVYPLVVDGEVQAFLTLGQRDQARWQDTGRALFRSLGRSLNLAVERAHQAGVLRAQQAELETQTRELEAQTRVLEAFSAFSHDLTVLQEPYALIRRAQSLILAQLPPGYSVYYELEGGLWHCRAQVGTLTPELQALVDAGRPYADSLSSVQAWESGQPVYHDQHDPASDAAGLLASHVRAHVTLPVRVRGRARGLLRVALTAGEGGWSRVQRVMLETLVQQLGTVLNAADQAAALESQRAATLAQSRVLEAFAVFAQDLTQLGSQEDVIRRAQEIVLSLLPPGYALYFEPQEDRWMLRAWSGEVPEQALAAIRHGRPLGESRHLEVPWESGQASFQDAYDPAPDRLGALAGPVTATASFPVTPSGDLKPLGVMTLALTGAAHRWTDTERTVIGTMLRQLGLVLGGVRSAELLRRQNAQLEAQSRSLQGFSELTRQLSTQADPLALVQRALEGMMSLLPEGYAVYLELEGGRWRQRVMAGDYRNAELEALIAAGLPYETTTNLTRPWEERQPLYQDAYATDTDGLDESLVGHLRATACLPVLVAGQPRGVIGCALFARRVWTPADRAVLESIVRSLGLAIEGAQGLEALQRQTVELQRSNAELERFAYIASHDLQEPLRTISSFSDLLIQRYQHVLDPKARQYLEFIHRGSGQMKALVDDLLTFSRLSAERARKRPLPLAEPLQEALSRLDAALQEAGAQLEVSELPTVLGDGPQLAQLFQNLIGNAVKFRRAGVPPQVRVMAQLEGELWHVQVQDNGIGMKPEYFGRIFVMFQRLHHRSEYQGTGLGLSIAQKIVEGHGGRIWPTSQEGAGSTFHFTLPGA